MIVAAGAWAADGAAAPRVEARSSDLFAVGLVQGDTMSIHVSRIADNSPVRDAVITVVLRGIPHPTTAETDGGYSLRTKDLMLPGAAAVDFHVMQGAAEQSLKGTLDIASAGGETADKNSARQLWWWVLNFTVCGAAFYLFTRRKSAKT
ncbi:MAG TPA: hypothetical protein VN815_00340 [Steroidobacteraceae bacterium]|jgi:hypothetical protein|nr:hypothetical protein [Steroidobacteraceae bacterium]